MANRIPYNKTKPPVGAVLNGAHPLSQGLVGYWLFNEQGGIKANDVSGRNNHGTLTNGPTWNNQGLSFDGTDDFVDAGNSSVFDLTSKMSISFWMKPTNVSQNAALVSKWTTGLGTDNSYIILLGQDASTDKVGFHIEQSDTTFVTVDSVTGLSANTWCHIIGIADGSNISLYMNGSLVAGPTAYDGTIHVTTKKVLIGKLREEDSIYNFNGALDDVRIYNRALSAQEVQQLYVSPFCNFLRPQRRMIAPVAAGGGLIKSVNGLAYASVKTWNGLAVASVKTINGLASQ